MNLPSATAATAYLTRAWSYTFDSLIGNHISQMLEGTFSEHMPCSWPHTQTVAVVLVLLMAGQKGSELSWEAWTVNGGAGVGRACVPGWLGD